MNTTKDLQEKVLICQELGTKAAMAGLIRFYTRFNPEIQSFAAEAVHVDSRTCESICQTQVFLDQILSFGPESPVVRENMMVFDSFIAFLQGILDSQTVMRVPKAEPEQVAA